ncbi:glutamine dumper 3 [Prunus dulcis]|uniref:Glutamine dumper 3 n=1 Tax=Prunus dulcis TaxID=3755 RepID=A0A4Y1QM03_PRUDU|nr:protein GLUTAMINE DUMPER 3 [Prunus dulcis]BBG92905.1 glutamine dumper 3 [Prunus dulcis]VVA18077.1 PREDICTED: GLUTAMINE DUMPER [Prunus dulcis]
MAGREPFNVTARAPAVTSQRSPWHSPVPYLFGGLAAMLGLIAFALLILACSYWKLSGYLESGENGAGSEQDLEAGEGGKGDETAQKAPPVFEEKILVIMAGDAKPTFLATPMSSRSSSFGDNSSNSSSSSSCSCSEKSEKSVEMSEVGKQENGHDHQVQASESRGNGHEASDQSDQRPVN